MAKEFGIAAPSYSRWESGTEPTLEKLVQIATYFKVSIDDLLRRDFELEGTPPNRWGNSPSNPSHLEESLEKLQVRADEQSVTIELLARMLADVPDLRKECAELRRELEELKRRPRS